MKIKFATVLVLFLYCELCSLFKLSKYDYEEEDRWRKWMQMGSQHSAAHRFEQIINRKLAVVSRIRRSISPSPPTPTAHPTSTAHPPTEIHSPPTTHPRPAVHPPTEIHSPPTTHSPAVHPPTVTHSPPTTHPPTATHPPPRTHPPPAAHLPTAIHSPPTTHPPTETHPGPETRSHLASPPSPSSPTTAATTTTHSLSSIQYVAETMESPFSLEHGSKLAKSINYYWLNTTDHGQGRNLTSDSIAIKLITTPKIQLRNNSASTSTSSTTTQAVPQTPTPTDLVEATVSTARSTDSETESSWILKSMFSVVVIAIFILGFYFWYHPQRKRTSAPATRTAGEYEMQNF